MLGNHPAIATLAVKDLDVARRFYEQTLGLRPTEQQEPGALSYQTAGATIFVYASQYAGTNQATALTWIVDDVEAVVRNLREKGITFEHYDLPGMRVEGDLHIAGDKKLAWFKDPDGNIHALAES